MFKNFSQNKNQKLGNTKEEEGKEQITETLDIPEDDVVQDSASRADTAIRIIPSQTIWFLVAGEREGHAP